MADDMEELQEPAGLGPGEEQAEDLDPSDPLAAARKADEPPIGKTIKPPRRKQDLVKDKDKLLQELIASFDGHIQERAEWAEMRIQRTAKYRGWRETKTYPWEDANNTHLPIIMTDVQRTQDTLHNAVLSNRPVMNAKATSRALEVKERTIDMLLDHQVFIENGGELKIGNLISSFVEEGMFISYNPYIKEKQKFTTTNVIDFPPPGTSWDEHILKRLQQIYAKSIVLPGPEAPWNWIIKEEHPLTGEVQERTVEVYQDGEGEDVQLVSHANDLIFDGPAFIPKELEDIVVPHRCENLQPQTMANPKGALRVFMVEYPMKDEILKLIDSGFYDEVTPEDKAKIEGSRNPKQDPRDPESQKILRDDLVGIVNNERVDQKVEPFERIMYFGRADLDGDGFEEEVVYWFLKEPQVLLRCRYLSEVYPVQPMRRPFAMAKYIPINDQFYAIGLLELMESGYDIIKKVFDQMLDTGDLTLTPWGFYRPMSGVRPEVMRMGPGDLYPSNNPKEDVHFPQFNTNFAGFGQNTIAMVSSILDQATLVGQLQLGGVPQGKSAALRTTSNMQALLQQGDARPERVLRRFFHGLSEIWAQFHELNQVFLPKNKKFRISVGVTKETDPYVEIPDRSVIQGRYQFEFGASILNTNKAIALNALQTLMGIFVNPLLLQLGIVNPDNIYTMCSDLTKALGQDPAKYLNKPQGDPFAGNKITAEDAIMSCMQGYFPYGSPMEPLDQHIMKIQEFVQDPKNMEALNQMQISLLAQYAAAKIQEMQQMMQQQQMMQAAAQMQQQVQGSQGKQNGPPGQSAPPKQGPAGQPSANPNELLDESLPGAGGGQNG